MRPAPLRLERSVEILSSNSHDQAPASKTALGCLATTRSKTRAGRFVLALLPMSHGSYAYTKQAGKLCLREFQAGTDRRHSLGIDTVHLRRPTLVTTQARAGFTDALDEFYKFGVFQGNSGFTI